MVLSQKQTHRSMKQNQEPRYKPMQIQSTNFQQRCQEYTVGKVIVSSINSVGKLNVHMQKNKTGPLSHTIHKNQLKMD